MVMAAITLGTDPELFVLAGKGKYEGAVVPSYFALGIEDKPAGEIDEDNPPPWWYAASPIPHGDLVGDGAAIEWTQTPRLSADHIVSDLSDNIQAIRNFVRQRARDLDGSDVSPQLSMVPALDVPGDYIRALTPNYGPRFSLQILGCSPDHSVYTQASRNRPDPRDPAFTLRTSGGHMHFGVGALVNNYTAVSWMTAMLDRVLGTAAVMLCGGPEFKRRMDLYGDAGTIRVKYKWEVVEYRVLPAMALLPNPQHALMMFTAGQAVAAFAVDMYDAHGEAADAMFEKILGDFDHLSTVAAAINNSDAAACTRILTDFEAQAPTELRPIIGVLLGAPRVSTFELEW
jgi:hypothetical protein